MHPLSEGGAPAGRDGEEGGSEEAGVGQESGRGSGRGISLSFSSSEKKFEKICGKIWRGTEKTFIFASAFARKNR